MERREQLKSALEQARAKRAQPKQLVPLPNYDSGPRNPRPVGRNFYQVDDRYPGYLLCTYDINETVYSADRELQRLVLALKQIRELGPAKFPPIERVALLIENRAEHKGVETFASSHKVGSVYKADEVFDSSFNLEDIVARSPLDHSPFQYDSSASEDLRQQWVLIEHFGRGQVK